MQEKKNSYSNGLGICQRLFNFFSNSLVARGLKRVTLGQSLPRGYDSSIPAKSNGELMIHHKVHENSGSEIQVLFKQYEELESWTPVDPVVPKISDQAGNKIDSEQQPSGRKKDNPLVPLEKTEQRLQGKWSDQEPNFTLAIEDEEPKRTLRRLRPPLTVAPNINEKSDEFIRSKKEEMIRIMGMEPEKIS